MTTLPIKRDNPPEWYIRLVEDCRATITERTFNATSEIIELKWELGNRILADLLHYERAPYGEKLIGNLAVDLGISAADLYRCVDFRKQFESVRVVWEKLPEGKAITWRKIVHHYLPKNKQGGHENCGGECEHKWSYWRICLLCELREKCKPQGED